MTYLSIVFFFFLAAGEFKQVVLNKIHRLSDVLGVFHTEYEIAKRHSIASITSISALTMLTPSILMLALFAWRGFEAS